MHTVCRMCMYDPLQASRVFSISNVAMQRMLDVLLILVSRASPSSHVNWSIFYIYM